MVENKPLQRWTPHLRGCPAQVWTRRRWECSSSSSSPCASPRPWSRCASLAAPACSWSRSRSSACICWAFRWTRAVLRFSQLQWKLELVKYPKIQSIILNVNSKIIDTKSYKFYNLHFIKFSKSIYKSDFIYFNDFF